LGSWRRCTCAGKKGVSSGDGILVQGQHDYMSEVKDLDVIGIRDPTAILILGKLDDFVELPGLQTGYVRISPF
jgi:hypothetical protein